MTSIRHYIDLVESAERERVVPSFDDLTALQAWARTLGVHLEGDEFNANGQHHIGVGYMERRPTAPEGIGRRVIGAICRYADEKQAIITLQANDRVRLPAYYAAFGFEEYDADRDGEDEPSGPDMRRLPKRLTESAGSDSLPDWFERGRPLTQDDLVRLDAAEFIEGDEWDYEWRLCKVPISALPPYDQGGVTDEDRDERFRSIGDWYRSHGVDQALMTSPIVMLITLDGTIRLLDGWHRTEIARRQGAETVVAMVAHGEPDFL